MNQDKKAIVFVDLSGSTTIFEEIGDEKATMLVRKVIHDIATHMTHNKGQVLKFMGDGVMVLFDLPEHAITACLQMNDVLVDIEESTSENLLGTDRISVRVGLDYGKLVEFEDDAYGDIVNVASRILALAQPGELMMTSEVYEQLSPEQQERCRHLGRVFLRGKSLPKVIYGLNISVDDNDIANEGETRYSQDTIIASVKKSTWTDSGSNSAIVLNFNGDKLRYTTDQLPITIGRSLDSDLVVPDARVSRAHVRLDWFSGQFYLTDVSINGTMVQYGGSKVGDPYPISMRRQRCTLIKTGFILLGLLDRDSFLTGDHAQIPPTLRFVVENKGLHL